jgi:DNA-binding NarL/FixJ family response regulator
LRLRWTSARPSGSSRVTSPLTAKTHITRAIAKLSARDRVQLVIIAYEDGLVGPLS